MEEITSNTDELVKRVIYQIPHTVGDRVKCSFLNHFNGDFKNEKTCILWGGQKGPYGQPLFNLSIGKNRKKISAKLVSIAIFTDKIVYSNDKVVSNCENDLCVSPKHNFIVDKHGYKKRKICVESNNNKKIKRQKIE